jgi:hypothetical protein
MRALNRLVERTFDPSPWTIIGNAQRRQAE